MSVILCVLLWARPGAEEALTAYEERVLSLLPYHGGRGVITGFRGGPARPPQLQALGPPGPGRLIRSTSMTSVLAIARSRSSASAVRRPSAM